LRMETDSSERFVAKSVYRWLGSWHPDAASTLTRARRGHRLRSRSTFVYFRRGVAIDWAPRHAFAPGHGIHARRAVLDKTQAPQIVQALHNRVILDAQSTRDFVEGPGRAAH